MEIDKIEGMSLFAQVRQNPFRNKKGDGKKKKENQRHAEKGTIKVGHHPCRRTEREKKLGGEPCCLNHK